MNVKHSISFVEEEVKNNVKKHVRCNYNMLFLRLTPQSEFQKYIFPLFGISSIVFVVVACNQSESEAIKSMFYSAVVVPYWNFDLNHLYSTFTFLFFALSQATDLSSFVDPPIRR